MNLPSVLVSYAMLKPDSLPLQGKGFDEWVLDSGAYTAHNSGKPIRHEDFLKFALEAKIKDPRLKQVFALDVIGNPEESLKNALAAKAAGLDVIPTWHAGEPMEFAQEMARQFDKMALGGLVARLADNCGQAFDTRMKVHYAEKFFEAVWPKWIHGFGCTAEELLSRLPFAAVDSTTWVFKPFAFGGWQSFGGYIPGVRNTAKNRPALKTETEWYMRRERFHNAQWRRELDRIGVERARIRLAGSVQDIADISAFYCPDEVGRWNRPETEETENEPERETLRLKQQEKPVPKSAELEASKDYQWGDYWSQRIHGIKENKQR